MTQPHPKVQQVIAQQRAALLRGDVATLARYAKQWQQVEAALADKAELLARDVAAMEADGDAISEARLYQMARYQSLIQQTRAEIERYAQQLAPDITQQQQALAQQGATDAQQQIVAITGSFMQLPGAATTTAIGFAADGSPLVNLLRATWVDAASAMTQALLVGVAAGYNPRKVAKTMQQASGSSLNRMLTIARTEMLRSYRTSTLETYQRANVKRYRRLCAKQDRTCPACLALDGKEYATAEMMPTHPNCRCSLICLPDGYSVNVGLTGEQWFAQQDSGTQQQILGTSGYTLWSSGKAALADFATVEHNDTWGATVRVTPTSNL